MDKVSKLKYYGWRLGDRYDGWRVRKVDALFSLMPVVLPKRVDSEVFYQINIPVDIVETFVKEHKKEIPDLTIMHIVMAAMVRVISQRPHVNRFIVWNKIFARNYLSFSLAIKRSMSDEGEETVIKPYFLPTDSLSDIVEKTNSELENNQQVGQKNDADFISKTMGYLPDFLLRTVMFFIKHMDFVGIMPKVFFRASPFHSTLFLTNMGSLGADSVYHHLYEFGTCSVFASMGKKIRKYAPDKDGTIELVKYIELKFVVDERICDGFYFASTMRMLDKIFSNPSVLLLPPEKVIVDEGVGSKRIDL
jgi:hypothetical protein